MQSLLYRKLYKEVHMYETYNGRAGIRRDEAVPGRGKDPVRVLHISTHMNIGGVGQYILSLSRELKRQGTESFIASSGGDLIDDLVSSGIGHRQIPIKTKFEFHPKLLLAAARACDIVKKERIDIVHAHSRVSQVTGRMVSAWSSIPLVTTCHGFFKVRSRRLFDTWGDKVIAISREVKEHLASDHSVEESRIVLIQNGIDLSRFARDYSREEIDALKADIGIKTRYVIGSIGRLSPVKGHRYLIEAMKDILKEVPDTSVLLIGEGGEEHALREAARASGVSKNIFFLRSVRDTARYLAVMDIFAFPSVQEGLGLALLEAGAASRPSVASRIGGIESIVEDGVTGILVPVGDVLSIAGNIAALLKDDARRARMGSAARQTVGKGFSISEMAEGTSALYRQLIERKVSK